MPPAPSAHAIAALLLTVAVFGMLASGRMRLEVVCLLLIALLAIGFDLFPLVHAGRYTGMEVAFGGFGHEALVSICCLMILGRGLVTTGALEPAARVLARLWQWSRTLGMVCSVLVFMGLSMFVNDTPVLVLAMPMLLTVASRVGISTSKVLMPVNCAILIGGMATAIGTSTNLLVASISKDLGVASFGLFSFSSLVLLAGMIAVPYLCFVMPRLLPATDVTAPASKRIYDGTLHLDDSPRVAGRTLEQLQRRVGFGLRFRGVRRHGVTTADPGPGFELAAHDRLLVSGTPEQLREASELLKTPLASRDVMDLAHADAALGNAKDQRIAELVVGAESGLVGQSVKSARLADRYGIAVLGLARSEQLPLQSPVIADELRPGDVLLVQGAPERLVDLELNEGALLLEGGHELPQSDKAPWALLIAAAVVALAALNVVPIAIAALAGTIAMLATGCLRTESIGRALRLEVIVLIAASIALGRALTETGAATWLGAVFAFTLKGLPPAVILAALMVFTAVLTNFVSAAVAAAIGTPIAVSLSAQLGIRAEPFVLAVLFGCNLSYVTPMAYQTNVLIMSAARYRFADFVRAGLPLAVLMTVVLAYGLVQRYAL